MRARNLRLIVAAVALFLHKPLAWAEPLTVEQAYADIPHVRPIFNFPIERLPDNEAAYLKELFYWIDRAVKERVETYLWLTSDSRKGDPVDEYPEILAGLERLKPPAKLADVHALTLEAVREHQMLFQGWRSDPTTVSMIDPLVGRSSQNLHTAYSRIVQIYDKVNPKNRQAFYDYFCCLDFL